MKNDTNLDKYQKVQDIIDKYDDLQSEIIGVLITLSIEYLIDERNYDFEKILKTIKRCHNKIIKQ